jgi:molybdopterin-guanine dinucleotide biosynthesis protein A
MGSGLIFTAAILAGGQARRLGGVDKGALTVGTRSILERQLSLLRRLTPHILVVTSDRSRAPAAGVSVVTDRIAGAGSLGGLYTALMEAPTEQVLVIACDMPFLTAPFLTRLVACGADVEVALPRDARGRHPLCASYARRIAGRLEARIERGDLRVGDAIRDLQIRELGPDELAPFDRDGLLLLNVNTPEDYATARTALASSSRA